MAPVVADGSARRPYPITGDPGWAAYDLHSRPVMSYADGGGVVLCPGAVSRVERPPVGHAMRLSERGERGRPPPPLVDAPIFHGRGPLTRPGRGQLASG